MSFRVFEAGEWILLGFWVFMLGLGADEMFGLVRKESRGEGGANGRRARPE
jgi:asparagine synthetase B (glutamine-hydrolysing)